MLIFLLTICNCEYGENRKILFVIQEKTNQARGIVKMCWKKKNEWRTRKRKAENATTKCFC